MRSPGGPGCENKCRGVLVYRGREGPGTNLVVGRVLGRGVLLTCYGGS